MNKKSNPTLSQIDREEKLILLDSYSTAKEKVKLINEIKTGLGVDIKKNPGKANIIKKTRLEKIIIALKKILTKF